MNRVEELARLLEADNRTVGTAESCTGGYIAHLITLRPGSSAYFKGGIVSYCNEVKHRLLGVSEADLQTYGAVSEPVVRQMACGAARVLDCDCAVATSGIAGPGGAVPGKPVGTVWMAAFFEGKVLTACHHFEGNRQENIEQAADSVIALLIRLIKEKE